MELRHPSPHMGGVWLTLSPHHLGPSAGILQCKLSELHLDQERMEQQAERRLLFFPGRGRPGYGAYLVPQTQLLVEWDEINGLIVVVVNFMYQIDWAIGYPAIWLNILGMSRRVFLGEINFWIGLNREVHPPQCGGPCPISWGLEKKAEEGTVLSARLSWDIGPLLL